MVIRVQFKYLFTVVFLGAIVLIGCINLSVKIHNTAAYDSPLDVLIIDAGHGGADGGAVGIDGTLESYLNLHIALKLQSICHLYGVSTVMTRDSEKINYPEDADTLAKMKSADQNARLRLIQDYPHGILFSIHQNYFPSQSPSGVQVLYGHDGASREVGELLQRNLTAVLCPDNRRVATEIDENIYLLRKCDCTAVLIECGFLSNPDESAQLKTENYQRKIASVLLASYLQYADGNKK